MKNQKLFLCCLLVIGSTLCSTLQAQDEDSQQENAQQQEAAEQNEESEQEAVQQQEVAEQDVYAQEEDSQQNEFQYKRFSLKLQAGGSMFIGYSETAVDYFTGLALEFNYEIIPNLQIGLRSQTHSNPMFSVESDVVVDIPFVFSGLLTADYFYLDTKFRPFVGLGLGFSNVINVNTTRSNFFSTEANVSLYSGFLIRARAGLDFSHVRLELAPELILSSERTLFSVNFALGGFFWGGKN